MIYIIIAVTGFVSGVGATTAAANLAVTLANKNHRTLAVELSGRTGLLSALGLDEKEKEGIYANTAVWENRTLLATKNGLAVLPGKEQANPGTVKAIIGTFSNDFEHLVFDLGSTRKAGGEFDRVVLVTEPTQRCLINRAADIKHSLLVVNRTSKRAVYPARDIARWYKTSDCHEIPEDLKAVKLAISKQQPLVQTSKRIAVAFDSIAVSLLGITAGSQKTELFNMLTQKFGLGRKSKHKDISEILELYYEDQHGDNIKDPLTGCFNRKILESLVLKNPCAVIFIDLDNFKPVNDLYGHEAGDIVLKNVGKLLLGATRRSDIVVRLGGDEFILILSDTDIPGAKALVEKLRGMWKACTPKEIKVNVTFSAGISLCEGGGDLNEAIKAADEAMYRVKRSGKNNTSEAYGNTIRVQPKAVDYNSKIIFVTEESIAEASEYVKKSKKPMVVIDAETGRMACLLGVDPNTMWRHDWRVAGSEPVKKGKLEIYCVPMERGEILRLDEMDIRKLKERISTASSAGKKVLISCSATLFNENIISEVVKN